MVKIDVSKGLLLHHVFFLAKVCCRDANHVPIISSVRWLVPRISNMSKFSYELNTMAALTLHWMGQPSLYHATMALVLQIDISNLDRTKSSLLSCKFLYQTSNFTKVWVTRSYHPSDNMLSCERDGGPTIRTQIMFVLVIVIRSCTCRDLISVCT